GSSAGRACDRRRLVMRFDRVLVRIGALTVLASSTLACNTILGVEEVALNCNVEPQPVAPTGAWTLTPQMEDTQLGYVLSIEQAITGLSIELWDDRAGHRILSAGNTYPLTPEDGTSGCGICVELTVTVVTSSGTVTWIYDALPQGSLTLTMRTSTNIVGSMHNVRFHHVIEDPANIIDANDGCSTTI